VVISVNLLEGSIGALAPGADGVSGIGSEASIPLP